MKKISTIILTVLAFGLYLLPNTSTAQITCKEVSHESCKPGNDGAAKVVIPAKLAPYCTVEWTTPDGQKLTGASQTGLKAGAYSVEVKATPCNKVIFQDVVLVQKEHDCRIYAAISVSTNSVPCNVQPTATLTASAWGGTPPYTYSWKTKTVSGSGTYGVTVTDSNGFVGSASVHVSLTKTKCPEDPNEIDGPIGYGDDHMVSSAEKMQYTILYENSAEFASAPASRVNIVYPIPPQHNISSVRLSDFGFGSFVFNVPSNTTAYTQRLDVADSLGVWVDVTAGIDMANNQIFWNLQAVDPATGFEPASSEMGFLLINDSLHHGEGYVSFTIAPKRNVVTGDTVAAEATIVFNENTAIATNVWTNTFDAVPPTSQLFADIEAADSMVCNFTFAATDDPLGSGVDNVELLVSRNGSAYSSVGFFNLTDTAHYTLEDGNVYQFISRATDNVGNQEALKAIPDTIINNNTAPVDILLSNKSFAENAEIGTLIGTLSSLDNDITLPFVYALVNGVGDNDNAKFYIEGNRLYTAASFSCTGIYEYSIRISTTDITGLSFDKAFTLTVNKENNTYNLTTNEGICQGRAYEFGSRLLTSSGTYTDSLTTVRGCDSIITVNLTVHPTSFTPSTQDVCQHQTLSWLGRVFSVDSLLLDNPSTTLNLYDTLYTHMGCDSIFSLALTVHPASLTQQSAVACDSYTWHGTTYTTGGDSIAQFTTQNIWGCDSVILLNLTLNHATTATETATACDSYTWINGVTYTSSTSTPSYTGVNAAGCDSIVTLHLTVNHSSTSVETVNACDSYTWINGVTYTSSTSTPSYTSVNAVGCDSTVTLHLTLGHESNTTESVTACDSYTWHGTTYTASNNTATYTTQDAAGCDSTVTLNLTLHFSSNTIETATACDSYTWIDGVTYTGSTSTPSYTSVNVAGCDSIVTLHLTINHSTSSTETIAGCDSYTWNGTTFTSSATLTDTLTNTAGCDSLITLNLTINHSDSTTENVTACDNYNWLGMILTNSTTLSYTFANAVGCDSVVTLNLTVNHSSASTESATECDSYTWHGMTLTASGTATDTLTNAAGCDSVVTLNLTLNYSTSSTESLTACDSLTWHGTTYTASTSTPTYTTQNAAGCDSVVTLLLTINHSAETTVTDTATGSYTWHDSVYTQSGTYRWQGLTQAGCDSTVTLHLVINSVGIEVINPDGTVVNVYPNPTTGWITIAADDVQKVEVFDQSGRQVATHERTNRINLGGLPSGGYILKIHLEKQSSIQRVILK